MGTSKEMYDLKRFMIALDFSSTDETLIKYSAFICSLLKPEKVYFIHIQRSLDIQDEELRKALMPDSETPLDEHLKERMQQEITKFFPDHANYNTEFVVEEGSPLKQLLHWQDIKKVDLFITGKKADPEADSIITKKLARGAHCAVLVVPENFKPVLDKIIIGLDFSDNAKIAVELGLQLAEYDAPTEVYCSHSYDIPQGFTKSGKSLEEIDEIMNKHAHKHFDTFEKKYGFEDAGIKRLCMNHYDQSPAQVLINIAKQEDADMLIVGAKGRTDFSAVLLGSFTEKLIVGELQVPLMIVTDRKKSLSFWEALKRI